MRLGKLITNMAIGKLKMLRTILISLMGLRLHLENLRLPLEKRKQQKTQKRLMLILGF